jgi:hypothetical protein
MSFEGIPSLARTVERLARGFPRSKIQSGAHAKNGCIFDRTGAACVRHVSAWMDDVLEIRLQCPTRLDLRRVSDFKKRPRNFAPPVNLHRHQNRGPDPKCPHMRNQWRVSRRVGVRDRRQELQFDDAPQA